MMEAIIVMVLVVVLSGVGVFVSYREHLLVMLLSLEYIMLGIYVLIVVGSMLGDVFMSLVYLTFTACEGAVGISLMVMMSRTHGGDYFKTMSLL